MTSVTGRDIITIPGCPYGASYCPKVQEMRQMIEKNGQELERVSTAVIRLETTIKNVGKLLGALVSILIAVIGVIQI